MKTVAYKKKLLLFFSFIFRLSVFAQTDTTSIIWKEGYLDIHHINTGRGVCTFTILPDGTTMMVDAGDLDDSPFEIGARFWPLKITKPYPDSSKNSGEWIVDYMKQTYPSIKQLDYALITHFHGDHMGMIKANTKTSATGKYKLTGITQVGDLIPIKMLIDRNSPNNNFPVNLFQYYKEDKSFLNLQDYINYQSKNGLIATTLQVGSANQITLKNTPKKFPDFKVIGVKANGTIWTGTGNQTFEYFTADTVLDNQQKFNENPLSLAIKLTYGKFDYFTGGDNTGLMGYGLPSWFDVETPMAKAVGKVEVTTLNHHGNRDGTNENFLRSLQPNVVVEQTWCSDHPGQEVMQRLLSNHIYSGEKNIFATNIQDVTKHTLGFWFTQGYKSMFGHIIIRVLPGGNSYYVFIAETINGKVQITKTFGPYQSQ
jgi:beta-lactamase superfamily II metal-dependent hydrolase